MKLNLKKPLVIFDLETTGLDLVKDRVIQLSYIKVFPDGKEVRGDELINPEKTIPEVVVQLTGITNDDVKDKPTFKQLASKLNEVFVGSDIAGYNSNNFDVPLLAEEFLRAGIDFDFSKCRLIDACAIFRKMERRNLAAAYKFYCGRKMEDDFEAHRADQDTEATYRVLMGQLDKYAPGANEDTEKVLENDMDSLAEFSKTSDNVDFAGRIIWADVNGQRTEVFNFGKHKGKTLESVFQQEPAYYDWMIKADFPRSTKQVVKEVYERMKGQKLMELKLKFEG
jgi:DNA polymerase-3 subunit epsilon